MKVLVLGGNGMAGSMVAHYLSENDVNVTFTTRQSLPSFFPTKNKISVLKFDAADDLNKLKIDDYDFVINCIGLIKQKKCKDPDYFSINGVFPHKVANQCMLHGVKLIHLSSDCVFSGEAEQPYQGTETKDAKDAYGVSKAMGEPDNSIIIRTSIVGPSNDHYGLFEWLRNEKGNKIPGFTNHIWSGVTTLFLAQFIKSVMDRFATNVSNGVVQLASPPITKCVLLKNINNVFELGKTVVPKEDAQNINRTLVSSAGTAPEIHDQLVELKNWMREHGWK